MALARQSGRYAKGAKPYASGFVDECILRLDVLVDQAALVGMAERCCQINGKT